MKKVFVSMPVLLIIILLCLSCKKDHPATTTNTSGIAAATGYWFGTFTNGSLGGNQGQVFKADGTTVAYDFFGTSSTDTASCAYKAYGTYTVSGNTITFTDTYASLNETFTETATINTSVNPNTLTGTFTSTNGGSGSCVLTKH